MSDKECVTWSALGVSVFERSVLGGNVNWDLKMLSVLERCPLESVRYIEVLRVSPTFHPFLRKVSVVGRCPL